MEQKRKTISEVSFEGIDAEAFRKALIAHANELYAESEKYNQESFGIKKQMLTEKDAEKFRNLEMDKFWAEHHSENCIKKIWLLNEIFGRMSYESGLGHFDSNLLAMLKKKKEG